jgi:low affinity Fe/Cu permease
MRARHGFPAITKPSSVIAESLIRVSRAHNSFVGVEHLTDEELEEIRTTCEARAKAESQAGAQNEGGPFLLV